MIRLPRFDYRAPTTVNEAAVLLAEAGPDAMVLAGGTDLLPNMKRRQQTPRVLIALRGISELRASEAPPPKPLRPAAQAPLRQGTRSAQGSRSQRSSVINACSMSARPCGRPLRKLPHLTCGRWERLVAICASIRGATTTTSPTNGAKRSTSA